MHAGRSVRPTLSHRFSDGWFLAAEPNHEQPDRANWFQILGPPQSAVTDSERWGRGVQPAPDRLVALCRRALGTRSGTRSGNQTDTASHSVDGGSDAML
jgi:hypothetical protein